LWWWSQHDFTFMIFLLGGIQCWWMGTCYGVPYPHYQSFQPIKGHLMSVLWLSHELELSHSGH
jgi:hypothetical protein